MANYPVFDGHNDSLFEVHYKEISGGRDFFRRNFEGHIDLPRAREGGLVGGFFAVYVPAEPQYRKPKGTTDTVYTDEGYSAPMAREFSHSYAKVEAAAVISTLAQLVRDSQGAMQIVRTASESEECISRGIFAILLHFEGAEPIDPDLELAAFVLRTGPTLYWPCMEPPTPSPSRAVPLPTAPTRAGPRPGRREPCPRLQRASA